jgi:serine protease Do
VTEVLGGGPASAAGVEVGDLLVAVNGKPVPDYAAVRPALGAYAPGKSVTLRVLRGEGYLDLAVTLPDSPRPRAPR